MGHFLSITQLAEEAEAQGLDDIVTNARRGGAKGS